MRNAASNRDFWERWHLNIGFNHLEYDFKRDKKFRYRILPFALVGVAGGFINGSIDFERTLKTGNFIFRSRNESTHFYAWNVVNTISYNSNIIEQIPTVFAHEG